VSVVWTSCLVAQPFEGTITYKNTYFSKIPSFSDQQLTSVMGDRQEYYLKGGNYKSVTNGTYSNLQIYKASDNKLYHQLGISDTLYWIDGAKENDPIKKHQISKSEETVLGVKCDVLTIETATGTASFYFNPKYAVDPDLFKNHNYVNWNFVMEQIKAVPLKFEIETPQFRLISIATEIKPQKLDDKVFDLPSAPLKMSTF
jgi:hypothetical protein